MSETIWKFSVPVHGGPLLVPDGATVVCVGGQGDDVCVWMKVDPAAPLVERYFVGINTGEAIPAIHGLTYIGTAFLMLGQLVIHVFERQKVNK